MHCLLVFVYLFTFFAGIELLAQGVQATNQIVANILYAGCACCIGVGSVGVFYHAIVALITPALEIWQAGKRSEHAIRESEECDTDISGECLSWGNRKVVKQSAQTAGWVQDD